MNNLKNYKKIIKIPKNVKIEKKNKSFIIKGHLGVNIINLSKLDLTGKISFLMYKSTLVLYSNCKSFFKTIIKIIKDKIYGVNNAFLLYIRIVGIGYKIEIHNQNNEYKKKLNIVQYNTNKNKLKNYFCKKITNQILYFKAGFSHLFKYIIPLSIKVFLLQPTLICIYGIDLNIVTQIAFKIRQIKPPTVYKGKGIRLINEKITLKVGKR